jgi:hypothetical protein
MTTLLAVVADLHCNSGVGLCPPGFVKDNGDGITLSPVGAALWESWLTFWKQIDELKRRHNADCWVVVNGDSCDMNTHDGAGLRCHVRSDVPKMAAQVLGVIAGIASRGFIIRGTEAHAGGQGEMEETLAAAIGATPNAETGTCSWWHLPLDCEGVRFSIAHHPRTAGWMPYTKRMAALRQANIVALEAEERGEPPADVYIRSHTHVFVHTPPGLRPMVVYTPPWQLATSFSHRLGNNDGVDPPGGVWFLCDSGSVVEWDAIRFWPKRGAYWTAN